MRLASSSGTVGEDTSIEALQKRFNQVHTGFFENLIYFLVGVNSVESEDLFPGAMIDVQLDFVFVLLVDGVLDYDLVVLDVKSLVVVLLELEIDKRPNSNRDLNAF